MPERSSPTRSSRSAGRNTGLLGLRGASAASFAVVFASALLAPCVALASPSLETARGIRLAYIDPGAGSFVIQALVAAAAGVAVTLKVYWRRIRSFFGLADPADDDDDLSDDGA